MSAPMVSVVMPVRNGARFVATAIESVQRQTVENLELVVVDDGSTDATADIVKRLAGADPRIRLLEEEHQGISRSLNRGIEAARAPWIARLDADDVALADRLERQLAAAASRPEVAVWAGWAITIDVEGRPIGKVTTGPATEEEFRREHGAGLVEILHPTVLLRREVVRSVGGYDPRFDGGEDVELWDRVGEVAPILTIREPLIRFRVHPESWSTLRMAEGLTIHRFVAARRTARNAGNDLSWEEFQEAEAAAGWYSRLRRKLEQRAGVEYRRAGVAYATSEPLSMARHLAVAFLLRPGHVAARLWRQFLRPRLADAVDRVPRP